MLSNFPVKHHITLSNESQYLMIHTISSVFTTQIYDGQIYDDDDDDDEHKN